jgi:hypothetical protein
LSSRRIVADPAHSLRLRFAGLAQRAAVVALLSIAAAAPAAAAQSLSAPQPVGALGGPFRTAMEEYAPDSPEGALVTARMRAAGASAMKIVVSWSQIAPRHPRPGFEPASPFDSQYHWDELDRQIDLAVEAGLEPMVVLFGAPTWASSGLPTSAGGIHAPDPGQLGLFAKAAAYRYDGSNPGLPRVRYWGVWNEPNVSLFLQPQFEGSRPVSIGRYREMVNAVAASVKYVDPSNLVVAGELFPNGLASRTIQAVAPLAFLRGLFCVSAGTRPRRTCRAPVHADIVSVHPYSSGGPADRPAGADNVWIGNLESMKTLIAAAQRLGNLVASGPAGFWVTEFAWNTNPPSPGGVPVGLDARWVSEALYRMWRSGVGVATYFGLRDTPVGSSIFQSGLYYGCALGIACDRPKPLLAAFRFPFVAYTTSRRRQVVVWGRTTFGASGTVWVQIAVGRAWKRLATLRTDANGVFYAHLQVPGSESIGRSTLRAVLDPPASAPRASRAFSLARPRRLEHVTPFG